MDAFLTKPVKRNALLRMLDFDSLDGTRLLLEYGADPNEPTADHPSGQPVDTIPALHQAARRGRDGRYADLLLKHGARGDTLWQGHSAFALASIYGNAGFAETLARRGLETPLDDTEQVLADCARHIAPAGQPLAGRRLGDEARRILTRVILREDGFDHARCLVAAGIDDPSDVAPGVHIFTSTKQGRLVLPEDGTPVFEGFYRPSAVLPPDRYARFKAAIGK